MFSLVLLVLCIISIGYYTLVIYSAHQFFSLKPNISSLSYPPISILKPVCGIESMAYENLASFCLQNYPVYQIIFGVKEADDPIINVIDQIMVDFPTIDIQLVICDKNHGSNPKISSLITMQEKIKYSFWLISDSDIRVGPTYLSEMMRYMSDTEVGVVTSMNRPLATEWHSIIDAVANVTDNIPMRLVAKQLYGITAVSGCSVLIRKKVLDAIGGMQALADYISEDRLLGNLVTGAGYRIALSNYVIEHILDGGNLVGSAQRRVRWIRGSLIYDPWVQLSVLFTYGTLISALFLTVSRASGLSIFVFSLTWALRLGMGWIVGVHYFKTMNVKNLFWLSPLLDFVSFTIWTYSFLTNKVYWRGNCFTVEKNGKLVPFEKITD